MHQDPRPVAIVTGASRGIGAGHTAIAVQADVSTPDEVRALFDSAERELGPEATGLFFSGKTREQIDSFAKPPPLERLGEPGDIARIASFLVSTESSWVNSQVLRANGGTA